MVLGLMGIEMEIYLVRHGQTIENRNGITQGHYEGTLSDYGIRQAENLAHRFSSELIDVIISSDLQRAVNTALPITKDRNIPLIITDKIREFSKGIFDGKYKSRSRDYSKINTPANMPYYKFKRPEGESLEEYQQKVINFWNQFLDQYKYDKVIILSHSGFIKVLLLFLLKRSLKTYKDFHIYNASISKVIIGTTGRVRVQYINDTSHLR